jgi:hypothetical protein
VSTVKADVGLKGELVIKPIRVSRKGLSWFVTRVSDLVLSKRKF